jgi:nucleoside-diphosphate-sugar epimerase
LASSETLIGLPLDPHPPEFLPITEESERRPESAYSLSKLVGEDMAEQYARWDPEVKVISLRFSNVSMELLNFHASAQTWRRNEAESGDTA